jgi:hypothetical protein
MSLTPLHVVRVPVKEHKEHAAVPSLNRLRQPEPTRAEPAVAPPPPQQPRPAVVDPEVARAELARAITLSRQKAHGEISRADAKWLADYHAPQRGDLESPARRIEVEKTAKAICLTGEKVRGTIDPAGERFLSDYFAEQKAIEFLK